MPRRCEVITRFHRPPADLAPYFTAFLRVDIAVANGGVVTDYLHPEWANLRFHTTPLPEAVSHALVRVSGTTFPAAGPRSKALRFTVGTTRSWNIGLMPLGWARYVGAPASAFANVLFDGDSQPEFARFRPLARTIFGEAPDEEAELARIIAFFRALPPLSQAEESRVLAIHAALIDPEVRSVGAMAEHAGLAERTLIRLCRQHFGFGPKLLQRRQRFMRSLAHYMLDPSLTWIDAIDGTYHDQAQFVREFREFMGMTPRQYAALDHPVLDPVVITRAQYAGAGFQLLVKSDPADRARVSPPAIADFGLAP